MFQLDNNKEKMSEIRSLFLHYSTNCKNYTAIISFTK